MKRYEISFVKLSFRIESMALCEIIEIYGIAIYATLNCNKIPVQLK